MAKYDSLADLRGDIRSDDRGRFLDAADEVREAGLSVDDVEGDDPPVDELVHAGIIPEQTAGEPAADKLDRIESLLEQIAANTGGN